MKMELWPEEAPLAFGSQVEDRPAITAYNAENKGNLQSAVIVLPGGGYESLAHHEGEPIARWLNGIGITAFVLEYRVAPYKHPAQLLDIQRAIRYVRAHAESWQIDPARLGLIGFSAGGHLAATAGTHYDEGDPASLGPIEHFSCRPDFLMLCYPVISMGEFGHGGSRIHLLGEHPSAGELEYLSNELRVTADTPPTFLWHTADDPVVPVENTLLFARALSRCKVPFEIHLYQSGKHGLGLAEDHPEARTWPDLCARWLRRIGIL